LLVEEQVHLPLIYKNESLEKDFILDLLIEKEVIVELKAVEEVHPVHEVQLVTYLKLANKKLGLLINLLFLFCTRPFTEKSITFNNLSALAPLR